jgi:phage terminase large subunit GpA-like protein
LQFFGQKVNDPNARFPELNAMVVEIRKTNGQEAIVLNNGGMIELGARTGGAGRGSSFDVLVVDEAQEYEEDEQEALKPTISAAPGGDR